MVDVYGSKKEYDEDEDGSLEWLLLKASLVRGMYVVADSTGS